MTRLRKSSAPTCPPLSTTSAPSSSPSSTSRHTAPATLSAPAIRRPLTPSAPIVHPDVSPPATTVRDERPALTADRIRRAKMPPIQLPIAASTGRAVAPIRPVVSLVATMTRPVSALRSSTSACKFTSLASAGSLGVSTSRDQPSATARTTWRRVCGARLPTTTRL